MAERTRLEKMMIHEVMLMAYKDGIEEGKRQALEAMKKTKKSHEKNKNIYAWNGIKEEEEDDE